MAVYFITLVLLTNCWTFLSLEMIRGNNIRRFGIDPSMVEDDLKNTLEFG